MFMLLKKLEYYDLFCTLIEWKFIQNIVLYNYKLNKHKPSLIVLFYALNS